MTGVSTRFNTSNNTTEAGTPGNGNSEAFNGLDGSALGNSIFLRAGSSLTCMALNIEDRLTLGDGVSFVDDTSFGAGGTSIFVSGDGTVIYNRIADYSGTISINNANFKVNGTINTAPIYVCRNRDFSLQPGTLSGGGTLTGNVYVNSGKISPDAAGTLIFGSLTLNSADIINGTLGSLVHIEIDHSQTSLVSVTGSVALAGMLELAIDASAQPGTYRVLTSSGITGTFDAISFMGETPNYSLSYLPVESPTFVQFDFLGFLQSGSDFQGEQKKNNFGFEYELYNQLTWTASSSSQVTGYYIYRDELKIATLDASTLSYQDHNRPTGESFVYALVGFDSDGNVSSPRTITIS